jgi:ABC-type cobalamin/Fe3+-siderophores transport system ATPase subunit
VISDGALIAHGPPSEALSPALLKLAFGMEAEMAAIGQGRAFVLHGLA